MQLTLSQHIESLDPEALSRVSAALLQGQPLPEHEKVEWLYKKLVSFSSIQQRLDQIPVSEVARICRETLFSGGFIPWKAVQQRMGGASSGIKDLLQRYCLGTVGSPNLSIFNIHKSELYLIIYPEITISYLRNGKPNLPRLFALENASEPFMDAMDKIDDWLESDFQFGSNEGRETFFQRIVSSKVSQNGFLNRTENLEQLYTVIMGERLMERLSQLEHHPFHPWNSLSDQNRTSRALHHLLTHQETNPKTENQNHFQRRLVQVIRSLEAGRWYPPNTAIYLTVLQGILDEIEESEWKASNDLEPEPITGFNDFIGRLHSAYYPKLWNCGIFENAVSGRNYVGERISHDGMAALSHRIDWNHWQRLRSAFPANPDAGPTPSPLAEDTEIAQDTGPYLDLPPGQPTDACESRLLDEVRRFFLTLLNIPIAPTRKGKPLKSAFRKLIKLTGGTEACSEFIFDFVLSNDFIEVNQNLNRYFPTAAGFNFVEDPNPKDGKTIAGFFWKKSFDDGPISEDLRELKRLFVREFLAEAPKNDYARLDSFWEWLSDHSSQETIASHWRRYVNDDNESLYSISLFIARTLAWLGLADASPSSEKPSYLRLTPLGHTCLIQHRFETEIAKNEKSNRDIEITKDGKINASLTLPFGVLANLAIFTKIISLETDLLCEIDEQRCIEASRHGYRLKRFIRSIEKYANPGDDFLKPIKIIQKQFEQIQLKPAAGYLKIKNSSLNSSLFTIPELKSQIELIAGNTIILKPKADLKKIYKILELHGYVLQYPELIIEENPFI